MNADQSHWIDAATTISVGIAVSAAKSVGKDEGLSALAEKLACLPNWIDDPVAYRRALRVIWDEYRLPTGADLAKRSTAFSLLWRTVSCAFQSLHSSDERARARNLVIGSAAAGALFALARGDEPELVAEIDRSIRLQNAINAQQRKKAVAMRDLRKLFEGFLAAPKECARPEWGTYTGFGKWAAAEHGLRADYVARKAGEWAKEWHNKTA